MDALRGEKRPENPTMETQAFGIMRLIKLQRQQLRSGC